MAELYLERPLFTRAAMLKFVSTGQLPPEVNQLPYDVHSTLLSPAVLLFPRVLLTTRCKVWSSIC